MADAVQFTVPSNDFIQLYGAGESGSVLHQGGANESNASTIVFVEAAVKPTIDPSNPSRFQDAPATLYLQPGKLEPYYSATKIWAISQSGEQLLSVTPGNASGGSGGGGVVEVIIPGDDTYVDSSNPAAPIVGSTTPVIVQNFLSISLDDQAITAFTNHVIEFPQILQDNNITVEDGGTSFSSDIGGLLSVHVTCNLNTDGLPVARTYFDVWMQTKAVDGLWENIPYSNKALTVPEAGGAFEYTQGGIFLSPGWSVRFLFRTETRDVTLKAEMSSQSVETPSAHIAIVRQGS